jgi:hypothetical protein
MPQPEVRFTNGEIESLLYALREAWVVLPDLAAAKSARAKLEAELKLRFK